MALPKINEHLNFTMTIPSLGKAVKFRQYLVQEEKILLQAFESKDTETCLRAMTDTLEATIDPREKINVSALATFDVEYMFTQVSAKSVGETSTILINCKKCDEQNEYQIDLVKRPIQHMQRTGRIKSQTYLTSLIFDDVDRPINVSRGLRMKADEISAGSSKLNC